MSDNIQLGLCCMLKTTNPHYCVNTTTTQKKLLTLSQEEQLKIIQAKTINNLQSTARVLDVCKEKNIHVYRLSSDLFPHLSNKAIGCAKYPLDFAQPYLNIISEKAKLFDIRLSFHPGQFNVLASPNAAALESTIYKLDRHAEIMDRLNCNRDSVIVLHGGGMYGNKSQTKERWVNTFKKLSPSIQSRLVIENDEKCFNVQDCIDVAKGCGIPMLLDTFHDECFKILHKDETHASLESNIHNVLNTWHETSKKPKFHISEQSSEKRIGAHSDYIKTMPTILTSITEPIDVMVEAKCKDLAIEQLIESMNLNKNVLKKI